MFPGDHVDIIVTLSLQSEEKDGGKTHDNRARETVLHDVRVLAIDQRADDQSKDIVVAKTATLEVTPKQAEVVAVVSAVGQISLSLRSLARDEAEAAAESGRQKLSYTFDSQGTRPVRPPRGSRSK